MGFYWRAYCAARIPRGKIRGKHAICRVLARLEVIKNRKKIIRGWAVSRLNGCLASLFLALAVATSPAVAEEITVTVPLDSAPAAEPSEPASVPAPVEPAPEPVVERVDPPAAAPAPVAEEAASVAKQPVEETVPQPQAEPAAAAVKPPAKAPKAAARAPKKTKKTANACKGLDEAACGQKKVCIWVVGVTATEASTAEASASKARCRSQAVLKKEAKKFEKSHKAEVLPWASTSSVSGNAGATSMD